MPRARGSNKDKRHWAVALRRAGHTYKKCAEIAGVGVQFIRTWEKCYTDTGGVERKTGTPHGVKCTPQVKRFIRKHL